MQDSDRPAERNDMENSYLVLVAIAGVIGVIVAVTRLRLHPFVALLTVAICVGLAAGMSPTNVTEAITKGMGGTLGFVAVVVGLGSMFGMLLEESGGMERLAAVLINRLGEARAGFALAAVGFLICIPVFLDVALVMLLPLAVAVARRTGKSVTTYAMPMLAGMAVTHAFVPPTPGPTAVAQLLAADLGWVIAMGILTGLPTLAIAAWLSGTVIARQAAGQPPLNRPTQIDNTSANSDIKQPSVGLVLGLLLLPILLIVGDTALRTTLGSDTSITKWTALVGHPFTALLVATLGSFWLLGTRLGMPASQVQQIAERGLEPAGVILLVTGAGGVFKQVLIDSGAGAVVASALAELSLPTLLVAWLVAAVIRLLQGSATVAMITAAGLIAPLIQSSGQPEPFAALATLAIAAGATIASHVNDSGFWLVGRFLGLTTGETLRTWTLLETIISVVGLIFIIAAHGLFGMLT